MADERRFYLYPRSSEIVLLANGTPFYASATVGVARSGWPDLAVQVGVQEGRPVLNRLIIERSLGAFVRCSNRRCSYTAPGLPPGAPAFATSAERPMPCPNCEKGELRNVPSSIGPSGEVFSGPEFSTSDIRGIPWDRVVSEVVAMVAIGAARAVGDRDPGEAAEAAVGARRRRAPTEDLFRRVAAVVRGNPNAPTRAVTEQLHTSHRNASRWIGEAKRRGLLDDPALPKPTRPRRKSP